MSILKPFARGWDNLARFWIILSFMACLAAPAAARPPVLGDFAAEIRREDGHIDAEATVESLKKLGANTYFYLIWHAATDWEDLPAFADAARKQDIEVWVYLIPWSETPLSKKSWGYSEPFRVDYIRWAQEIARLSLKHPNIVGYVIDDFYTNTQAERFSEAYVKRMREAEKAINPRLRFYPLCYFQQPWGEFMDRFGALVDGVVAAYPKSRVQIGNALAYLNDEPRGASAMVEFPRVTKSAAGDKGSVWADLSVKNASAASLSFYFDDADRNMNLGHHQAFVRVDGKLVWVSDTALHTDDQIVDLDLSRLARGRERLRVELGVVETRGVGNYPVRAKFDDIWAYGFDTPSARLSEKLFTRKSTGAFKVNLMGASEPARRRILPMIVMPAGEGEQHEKRYPEPGTPQNIAAKVAMAVEMARAGRVEGVVTYCLPKKDGGEVFAAVQKVFREPPVSEP